MRKNIIMLLGMLIVLGLSGCGDIGNNASGTGGEQPELSSKAPEDKEHGQPVAPSNEGNDVSDSQESATQPSDTVSEAREEPSKVVLNEFYGTVNCVEDGSLLLVGSKIMLMDSRTLEIQKEAEYNGPLLISPQAGIYGDGFKVMGESSEEWRFNLVEFDRDLHVKQIADIEEAVASERELMACKLLSDGDKLLYNNIYGLYLFDFLSDETIDLTQDGINVHDFTCLAGKGDILFCGSTSTGERVLGMVDMKGEKQQRENKEHLWGEMWGFEDFALIEEAELVGRERERMVFRYDVDEGIRSFPLTDNSENGNITVSCRGGYYATCTYMESHEVRYVIRIYSSEDGRMIKELPLTYEEYGDNFRLNGYLICEKVNRIILYGTWRGQETDSWIVSESL